MIYLLSIISIITLTSIAFKARQRGLFVEIRDLAVSAIVGLFAGIFIGIGARIGMAAITFANGDLPALTFSGSFAVIATFSGFGIVLGLIYEGLFRELLWRSGLIYGLLITLCLLYPLSNSAAEVLNFQPTIISLIISTGIVTALMWLPFGISLEVLLSRWHQRVDPLNTKLPNDIHLSPG